MMLKINQKEIHVPDILKGWRVDRALPLDYLNSEHAQRHHRLQVFATKGVRCVVPNCTCEGAFLLERAQLNKRGVVMSMHIDVFTADLQLMTVDHHVPKGKGGKDHISNKFPMCERHNSQKKNIDPEIFYERFGKL